MRVKGLLDPGCHSFFGLCPFCMVIPNTEEHVLGLRAKGMKGPEVWSAGPKGLDDLVPNPAQPQTLKP